MYGNATQPTLICRTKWKMWGYNWSVLYVRRRRVELAVIVLLEGVLQIGVQW